MTDKATETATAESTETTTDLGRKVKDRAVRAGSSPNTIQNHALAQVATAATLALFGIVLWAAGEPWPWLRELHAVRGTGWAALTALLLSLTMTPLSRLAGWWSHRRGRRHSRAGVWIAYRRAFGVVSAVLAWVHLGLSLGTYLRGSWPSVWHWPYLRSGLVAACLLTLLFATSFPWILAKLRLKGWKELHRLAYLAAILVLHHTLLSPFASRSLVLGVFGICLLLAPLRVLSTKRRKAGDP